MSASKHDYSKDPECWKDPVETRRGVFHYLKRQYGTYIYVRDNLELRRVITNQREYPEVVGWVANCAGTNPGTTKYLTPDLALLGLDHPVVDDPVDHPVDHPVHYTSHPSGIECIEVTRHMGFNLGNAIKYIWRADLKGRTIEDLEKAMWYIKDEIDKRQKEGTDA